MDISYLYSVVDLYIQNDNELKTSLRVIKKDNEEIQFKFSKNNNDVDVTSINIELDKLLENNNLENILKLYKGKYIIIDEKYEYNDELKKCYWYVKLNNGRIMSFDNFSVDEINNIRNILYEIKYHREEIRVKFDDKQFDKVGLFRLRETGFANYKIICAVTLVVLVVFIISLWFFKNL